MTTQHAKSNAREGDGVADDLVARLRTHAAYLDQYRGNQYALPPDTALICDAADRIAAMQAQQGAEPDWRELLDAVVSQFDDPGCTCTFQGDSCCPHAIAAAALAATGAPR
jgi:hypothetical protein